MLAVNLSKARGQHRQGNVFAPCETSACISRSWVAVARKRGSKRRSRRIVFPVYFGPIGREPCRTVGRTRMAPWSCSLPSRTSTRCMIRNAWSQLVAHGTHSHTHSLSFRHSREERVAKEPPAPAPESQGPVDYVNKTIDWDCPCLAYALNGPCASQFKEAFTCFSFSEAEPKGADCIPQFTAMRDCQALNPDYYRVPDEVREIPFPVALSMPVSTEWRRGRRRRTSRSGQGRHE